MELGDLKLFVRVAELGTLSAVARERDLAVGQISRSMRQLDDWPFIIDGKSVTRPMHGQLRASSACITLICDNFVT